MTNWHCISCKRERDEWTQTCPWCLASYSFVEQRHRINNALDGLELLGGKPHIDKRVKTGVPWFDDITLGGIPPGMSIVVGGQPGSGKSTFCTAAVVNSDCDTTLYFGSEEMGQEIHNRAHKMGLAHANQLHRKAFIKHSSNIDELPRIARIKRPGLIIVDSLHSMTTESPYLRGRPGSHTQAKYACELSVDLAKEINCAMVMIAHITNGQIKGGKQIEHWPDAAMLTKSEEVGQEIRRMAKIIKGRFCEPTTWRDVTVREWSQLNFEKKNDQQISHAEVVSKVDSDEPGLEDGELFTVNLDAP